MTTLEAGPQLSPAERANEVIESFDFEPYYAKLHRQYEQVLGRLAKRAKTRYNTLVSAAVPDDAIDAQQLEDSLAKATKATRAKLAKDLSQALAVSFAVDPLSRALYMDIVMAMAGRQAERLVAGARETAANVILDALVDGWTVPDTAQALYDKIELEKEWQATMLARTDLIGTANATSHAQVEAIPDGPKYKTWLSARDDRVRPSHVDANGQTQPLDEPYDLDGVPLMFPGDPEGPDGEVINCRCVSVFTDTPTPVFRHSHSGGIVGGAWDESKHPRHPGGTKVGGQFARKEWLETSLELARERLGLAQRRRPRDVSGAESDNKAQIERMQTAVDRLEEKLARQNKGDELMGLEFDPFEENPEKFTAAWYYQNFGYEDKPDYRMEYAEQVATEEAARFMEYDRILGPPEQANQDAQYMSALRQHIEDYGIGFPIFIDYNEQTGLGHISEGHHRLEIARYLGMKSVPVVIYPSSRTGERSRPLGPYTGEILNREQVEKRGELPRLPEFAKPSDFGFRVLTGGAWNEEDHPREPAGESDGGRFTEKEANERYRRRMAELKLKDQMRHQRELREAKKGLKPAKTKHDIAKAALIKADAPKVGPLLRKLVDGDNAENIKALWDTDDPQDAIATVLDLDDAPSINQIEKAKREAYEISQQWLRRKYPEGEVTLYRGGTYDGPSRVLEPWTPVKSEALFFSRKTGRIQERRVKLEDILAALPALGYSMENEYLLREGLTSAGWDESKHPRHPEGDPKGGKFAPKDHSIEIIEFDLDMLEELLPEIEQQMEGQFEPGMVQSLAESALEAPHMGGSVAIAYTEDGEMAGAVGYRLQTMDFHGTPGVYVDALATTGGPGNVGTELMRHVAERAVDAGVPVFLHSVETAKSFYEKLGMHEENYIGMTWTVEEARAFLTAAAWDESKHPRHPEGVSEGGQFAPKGEELFISQTEDWSTVLQERGRIEKLWRQRGQDSWRAYSKKVNWIGAIGEEAWARTAKASVQDSIAAKLEGDKDFISLIQVLDPAGDYKEEFITGEMKSADTVEKQVAALAIKSWAMTSGDHDPTAIQFQLAAEQEFGLEADPFIANAWAAFTSSEESTPEAFTDQQMRGARKFLRAQYELTQEMFKEEGITHVYAYRGMNFDNPGASPPALFEMHEQAWDSFTTEEQEWMAAARAQGGPERLGRPPRKQDVAAQGVVSVQQNPLSSWAHNFNVANHFADKAGYYHAVVGAKIDVRRILSTPFTGFGCLSESEMVVLGGEDMDAMVWGWEEGAWYPESDKDFHEQWEAHG